MTLDCEVVRTREGAAAMRDKLTGELMHPVVGPLHEAQRLYIAPSQLEQRLRGDDGRSAPPIRLLDVGLGAGSNASAAVRLHARMGSAARALEIVSFERSLAALELALRPEHAADFGLEGGTGQAARALLERHEHHGAGLHWRLRLTELPHGLELEPPGSADVVFWDPFSPRANPALWSVAAFAALRPLCRAGATVHTYSGATATRAALLLAGFAVGVGEEVSRDKFSTCAALTPSALARPLDRRWFERLARSSAPFPPDAPIDALARIEALAQFAG